MRRKDFILIALGIAAIAGWFIFRAPDDGGEKKGILKERLRAAESAKQTLDAERASGRERLRLARIKADEQRALLKSASAALPFYQRRREGAEHNVSALRADVHAESMYPPKNNDRPNGPMTDR